MIPCKLVHDTGTMIRFRTSQLPELPPSSVDIGVLLPTGRLVDGHFNRHPQNPNISGPELVRYIKGRIAWKAREDILVEQRSPLLWVVHLLDDAEAVATQARVPISRIRRGQLRDVDLAQLLALADRERDRGRRWEAYKRIVRPSGLNRMLVALVGAHCMSDQCDACERFDTDWGAGSGAVIVEVHHIELVARCIDHSPRNLCVLCANHHRFLHGSGSWTVRHDGPNVVLGRSGRELVIRRPPTLFPAA